MTRPATSTMRVILLSAGVGVLEAACRLGFVDAYTLPAPSEMVSYAFSLLMMPATYGAIVWTMTNVFLAIAASTFLGIFGGIFVHEHPQIRSAVDPWLASYYAVPFFIFYPVLVALLGFNRYPLIVIGVIFAVPAVVSSMLDGLDKVAPVYSKLGMSLRMRRRDAVLYLILPATTPAIFTGLKLCVAYSFIAVIVSEFILSNRGLGFSIKDAYDKFDGHTMYGMLLITLFLVVAVNTVVAHVERRIKARWEA